MVNLLEHEEENDNKLIKKVKTKT